MKTPSRPACTLEDVWLCGPLSIAPELEEGLIISNWTGYVKGPGKSARAYAETEVVKVPGGM